ncbi:hypothetical protein [Aeromonas sp. FL131]|uniref:hypothetical protein n=1 Tax=Aeromonas sp. FL131 TaxID=3416715 RepID=UPI003CF282BB
MMIYLQKRVIDQNGRSPSSTENSKIRCGMTDRWVDAKTIKGTHPAGSACSTTLNGVIGLIPADNTIIHQK